MADQNGWTVVADQGGWSRADTTVHQAPQEGGVLGQAYRSVHVKDDTPDAEKTGPDKKLLDSLRPLAQPEKGVDFVQLMMPLMNPGWEMVRNPVGRGVAAAGRGVETLGNNPEVQHLARYGSIMHGLYRGGASGGAEAAAGVVAPPMIRATGRGMQRFGSWLQDAPPVPRPAAVVPAPPPSVPGQGGPLGAGNNGWYGGYRPPQPPSPPPPQPFTPQNLTRIPGAQLRQQTPGMGPQPTAPRPPVTASMPEDVPPSLVGQATKIGAPAPVKPQAPGMGPTPQPTEGANAAAAEQVAVVAEQQPPPSDPRIIRYKQAPSAGSPESRRFVEAAGDDPDIARQMNSGWSSGEAAGSKGAQSAQHLHRVEGEMDADYLRRINDPKGEVSIPNLLGMTLLGGAGAYGAVKAKDVFNQLREAIAGQLAPKR